MASTIRGALSVQGQRLIIPCAGLSRVGFGVTQTWAGLLTFQVSYDGVNFFPTTVNPFPSGAGVQTAGANGNWYADCNNAVAFALVLTTLTSGAPAVEMAAASDGSWQDAFLAASSHAVESDAAANTQNQITQGSQGNRAWRCRKVSGGFAATPAAPVKVTISDGPSSLLWAEYVSTAQWTLNLPPDPNTPGQSGGGVVNTPGNTMVVTVASQGAASSLSCEFVPA